MRILKISTAILFFTSLNSLTSCSRLIVGYKPDIEQGNILDKKSYNNIHKGMSKSEVERSLGNPVLNNTFDNNEDYYVYILKPGHGKMRGENFIVTFKNDKVVGTKYRGI